MLQKIFGESEEEEEEEGAELRPQKQLLPVTNTTTTTVPPPKTRKPLKRKREEGSLTPPEIATTTSPPPTTEALHQVTPPQKPVAPPTPALTKEEEPKRPMFKSRGEEEEEKLVGRMRDELPDKEDVAMFRLALRRLKEEGAELVGGVSWAHYPHDILSFLNFHLTIVSCPGPSHLGEVKFWCVLSHHTLPSLEQDQKYYFALFHFCVLS